MCAPLADDLDPAAELPSRATPRRHHTVPQLLLKAFLNANNKILTEIVDTGRFVELPIASASVRNGFHTSSDGSFQLEDFLANEVEGPAAPIIADLRSRPRWLPPGKEKKLIVRFFLAQFLRSIAARRASTQRAEAFLRENLPRHIETVRAVAEHFGEPFDQNAVTEELRAPMDSGDFFRSAVQEFTVKHTPTLLRRHWTCVRADPQTEFVLSDVPAKVVNVDTFAVQDTQGVARNDVFLLLPLSPAVALVSTVGPLGLRRTPSMAQFNEMTAASATQIYRLACPPGVQPPRRPRGAR